MTSEAGSHLEHLSKAAIRLIDHGDSYVMRNDTTSERKHGTSVGGDANTKEAKCCWKSHQVIVGMLAFLFSPVEGQDT